MTGAQPPRLARALLERVLAADVRDDILANLDDLHAHHVARSGPRFAAFWYWRDAIGLAIGFGRPALGRLRWIAALRAAGRHFVRAPGGAGAAATLAAGIGLATLVFALAWETVLRPVPFPDPDRLDLIASAGGQVHSPAQFERLRDGVAARVELSALAQRAFSLTGVGEPLEVSGLAVSTNHFAVFGMPPVLGRAFQPEDGRPGAAPVALISHALWRDRFGGDSAVLGRAVDVYLANSIPMSAGAFSGERLTVIGVLPPRYAPFGQRPAVVVPLDLDPDRGEYRNLSELSLVGRRGPAVSRRDVREAVREVVAADPLFSEVQADPDGPMVQPLTEVLVGDQRPAMNGALAAAGLVLLLACANVVSLLLVRLRRRERELAVRAALGAGSRDLTVQLVAEGFVMAVVGGVGGTVLALSLQRVMAGLIPIDLLPDGFAIGGPALAVAAGMTALVAVICGVGPALTARRRGQSLVVGREGGPSRAAARWSGFVVAGEVGLAVVVTYASLVVGAGLFRTVRAALGFETDGILTMRLAPAEPRYRDPAVRRALIDGTLDAVRQLPGIGGAGAIHFLPIADGGPAIRFRTSPADGQEPFGASYRVITPGYLETMRIPLRAGRAFTADDREGAELVGLVNETMARRLWPGEVPVGRRLYRTDGRLFFRVVGVVADVRQYSLASPPDPELYLPHTQTAWASAMTLVVRGASPPAALEAALRQIVRNLDPTMPITRVQAMAAIVRESTARDRMITAVFATFGALSLGLAAVGVFSVALAAAAERRREIGVRMAIGATRLGILRTEMARSARVGIVGLALGLAGIAAGAPLIRGLRGGAGVFDPVLLGVVLGLLAVVVGVAVGIPALNASRTEPARVLDG